MVIASLGSSKVSFYDISVKLAPKTQKAAHQAAFGFVLRFGLLAEQKSIGMEGRQALGGLGGLGIASF
jgi:hypothetical protein